MQLPHLTEKEVGMCARKNIKNVQKFKQMTSRDREKLLPKITKQEFVRAVLSCRGVSSPSVHVFRYDAVFA